MKEKIKRLIAAKAGALAEEYGIKDKGRVRRILEDTARDTRTWHLSNYIDPRDRVGAGVSFDPSLREALHFLPPEKALRTFELTNLGFLLAGCHAVRSANGYVQPMFTLSEFADRAEQLVEHLERDRDYLIRTGLPQRRFEKSEFLDRLLNRNYPVKLPVCVQANRSPDAQRAAEENQSAERDAEGNLLYSYSWVDKCPLSGRVRWRRGAPFLEMRRRSGVSLTRLRFCKYDDAPFIDGLPSRTARRVERERERFLELKMNILRTWIRRLRAHRKRESIWAESLRTLSKTLTWEDCNFFGGIDIRFGKLKIHNYLQSLFQIRPSLDLSGGLLDLISVATHLEQETIIGVYSKTKRAILAVLGDRRDVQSYFQVVDEVSPSDLFEAFGTSTELGKHYRVFLDDSRKRIFDDLKNELRTKVLIETLVKSEYAQFLKDFGQSQITGWATHLTEFGTIAPGGVGPEIGDAVSALSPGQEKDYKRFDYKCRDQVHVLGTRPMKRSNIIDVNGHRVRIGDSVLKLFLRLVLELKKRKGGWVNIHTLEEEGLIGDPLTYQRYSNLRKAFEGSLLLKNGQNFIESDGSKSYRVSTHPDFITYDKKKLAKQHPDPDINEIAKKLP